MVEAEKPPGGAPQGLPRIDSPDIGSPRTPPWPRIILRHRNGLRYLDVPAAGSPDPDGTRPDGVFCEEFTGPDLSSPSFDARVERALAALASANPRTAAGHRPSRTDSPTTQLGELARSVALSALEGG